MAIVLSYNEEVNLKVSLNDFLDSPFPLVEITIPLPIMSQRLNICLHSRTVDLGGPQKEWIRLVNREMKAKYFDNGLREYLSQDYYYVGIMIAVAMLQNGQMPAFIDGQKSFQEFINSSYRVGGTRSFLK